MKLSRVLLGSLRIVLSNRTRSLLAIGGVAIGIALVLVTSAVGEGARAELLAGTDSMGTRLLVVRAAASKTSPARQSVKGQVRSLKFEDSAAIQALESVEQAAPVLDGQLKVRSPAGVTTTMVVGTTRALFAVRGYVMERGRAFTDDDETGAARVAVLGSRMASRLFPEGDPVGQMIRVRGVPFDVIGVLRPVGASSDGSDHDSQILLPLRTAQRRLYDSRSLTFIYVIARDPMAIEMTQQEIGRLLRERHRLTRPSTPDDFDFQSQAKAASFRADLAQSLELLEGGFGAVALLIGGAGILGLMLLSVQERTTEIALRIAVGARSRDIAVQFLVEAVLLASLGGVAGTGLGLLAASAVASIADWHVQVAGKTLLLPVAISLATGVLAGVLPANKAARIPPILAFAQQ
jgi:putative ABC transport system permease protein